MTGDEARTVRLGLKLSARKLGEQIGVTESSIYRWEGRRQRQIPRLYEIALLWLIAEQAKTRRGDGDSATG